MKCREIEDQQGVGGSMMSKALAVMPRAAELCRCPVARGLDGNQQTAQKARMFLRERFGGKIRLEPLADGDLMALESKHRCARQHRSRFSW